MADKKGRSPGSLVSSEEHHASLLPQVRFMWLWPVLSHQQPSVNADQPKERPPVLKILTQFPKEIPSHSSLCKTEGFYIAYKCKLINGPGRWAALLCSSGMSHRPLQAIPGSALGRRKRCKGANFLAGRGHMELQVALVRTLSSSQVKDRTGDWEPWPPAE